MRIRPDREKIQKGRTADDAATVPWSDIKLRVRDPEIEEVFVRSQFRAELDDGFQEEYEKITQLYKESGYQLEDENDEEEREDEADNDDGTARAGQDRDGDGRRTATSVAAGEDVEMSDPLAEESAQAGTNGFADHGTED